MKKSRAMSIIIVIVVSLLLIFLLSKVLLKSNGDINQGNFRVNDVVIRSSLDVEEISSADENVTGFDSMTLNLSQRNNLSILIVNNFSIKDIYIDNLSISDPANKGNIVFYQNGAKDEANDISASQIAIYPEEKGNQILVSLNVDNVDFLKDVKLPDGINSVTFDGSLIKTLDLKLSDLKMNIKFNINIVDETGKLNVCKVNVKVPDDDLSENGVSIKRQNLERYKFSIEDNFIKKWLNKM